MVTWGFVGGGKLVSRSSEIPYLIWSRTVLLQGLSGTKTTKVEKLMVDIYKKQAESERLPPTQDTLQRAIPS